MIQKPLSHYATPRRAFVQDRNWQQIIAWQREGLVSIKPTARDQAMVVLTDSGRASIAATAP